MVDTKTPRRLRVAGLFGIVAVATVALLQVAMLAILSVSAHDYAARIDQSGLRRALTFRVLYAYRDGDRSELAASERELQALQTRFDDLPPADRATYQQFLAHPNQPQALALFQTYAGLTAFYTQREVHDRQRFRNAAITGSGVIVLVCALLYVSVLRPTEKGWYGLVSGLEEQRERFAAVFEENLDMMALYDRDGHFLHGNSAATRRLGFSAASAGELWTFHVPESDWFNVAHHFELAAKGQASEFESHFVSATGDVFPVLFITAPVRVSGEVVGVIGIAKDQTQKREAERALNVSNQRFRSLFEQHPDGIAAISAEGKIQEVNAPLDELSGYRSAELAGNEIEMLAPAFDVFEHVGLARAFSGQAIRRATATLRKRNGETAPVVFDAIPIRVNDAYEGTYVVVRDASEEISLKAKESMQRDRLSAVSELASAFGRDAEKHIARMLEAAVQSLDMNAGTVGVVRNDVVSTLYSVGNALQPGDDVPLRSSISGLIYGSNRIFTLSDVDEQGYRERIATLAQHATIRSIIGTTIFVEGSPMGVLAFSSKKPRSAGFDRADQDFVRVVAALMGSALARLEGESEIVRRSLTDVLTGLPNRAYFEDQLATAMARVDRHGGRLSVHFIDLDGFKAVNDRYGHEAGDDVLRVAALRLRSALRDEDVIARFGGDEFVVLQTSNADNGADEQMARRLVDALRAPFEGFSDIAVGASVGIAAYPESASDARSLLQNADHAMYVAKNQKLGVSVFTKAVA